MNQLPQESTVFAFTGKEQTHGCSSKLKQKITSFVLENKSKTRMTASAPRPDLNKTLKKNTNSNMTN